MTKQEIQELKASLSIREVIGRYTKLNRVGRRWMGLCPFHRRPASFPFRR
ncbi:CHC2 zinc finger domain-containing protein [Parabacteroides merdae]